MYCIHYQLELKGVGIRGGISGILLVLARP